MKIKSIKISSQQDNIFEKIRNPISFQNLSNKKINIFLCQIVLEKV